MNDNQNDKIAQISTQTLIIGVDILSASTRQVRRTLQGWSSGKLFIFENTNSEFDHFLDWIQQLMNQQGMEKVMVGMEPTGHYWLNLSSFPQRAAH